MTGYYCRIDMVFIVLITPGYLILFKQMSCGLAVLRSLSLPLTPYSLLLTPHALRLNYIPLCVIPIMIPPKYGISQISHTTRLYRWKCFREFSLPFLTT